MTTVNKMPTPSESNTLSPCIRNCCLNDDNICLGCFRTLTEIVNWTQLDTPARLTVLAHCAERAAALQLSRVTQP